MIGLVSLLVLVVAASAQNAPFTQGPFGFYGAGNAMWASSHCLDGSGSGSIFVTGYTDGTLLGQSPQLGGGDDWFITKFNKQAGFLTVNSSNPTLRFLMSPQDDQGYSCASDTSGSVYVAGGTKGSLGNTTRTVTNWDSVVAKYDSQMNRVWVNQFSLANDDFAQHIILSGNILYVVGWHLLPPSDYPGVYIQALDSNSGALLWSRPVVYGRTNTYTFMADATINLLTNDLIVVGKYYSGGIPGLVNASGTVPPSLPDAGGYHNGFIASFSPSGVFNWHRAIDSPRYDGVMACATDVTGAVFVSGYVAGRVNDAEYTPVTLNEELPFISKYTADGSHVWTNILPVSDNRGIGHVVVDGLGGVYGIQSYIDCFDYSSNQVISGRQLNCGSNNQATLLIKANSANGAIQYTQPLSSGVPNSVTLDREAVLTLAGQFLGANNNQLHGVATPTNQWYTFIDQQQLNYTCACSEITSVVNEMVQLLRLE